MSHTLLPLLEQEEIAEGFTVTANYESPSRRAYESVWSLNPLLFKGRLYIRRLGLHEIAEALRDLSSEFQKVTGSGFKEIKVSTKTERQQEAERLRKEIEEEDQEENSNKKVSNLTATWRLSARREQKTRFEHSWRGLLVRFEDCPQCQAIMGEEAA